ncbi:hypothetical protein J5N97_003667 [Dioscorea zingiberensis]|uniref:Uncharacterized protein n=1 Tax=Dioscorea zingiberensis TaxID=325984 RepID=A0A9D5D4N6_9LILI|nr:hypothetical protein J5N97_003667 [Dioscorea zingiberensis]
MAANYLFVSLFLISSFPLFSLSSSSSPIPVRSEYEVSLLYEGWLIKQNKSYKDLLEKKMRYEIFKDNLKYIDEHNAESHTFTLALNVFADITVEEYRSTYLGTLPPPPRLDTLDNESNETDLFHFNGTPVAVPDSIDWRDLGAVLPVRNQGGCFCCWAFATVATVEAINQIITGDLTPLSEQQLVDCECKSCSAYYRHKAYQYIINNGGIDSRQDYPYTAVYKKCDTSKPDLDPSSRLSFLRSSDEEDLRLFLSLPTTAFPLSYGRDQDLRCLKGLHRLKQRLKPPPPPISSPRQ